MRDDMREIVAQAIEAADEAHRGTGFPCDCGWEAGFGRGWADRLRRHRRLAIADSAIAATVTKLAAVEALADELERKPHTKDPLTARVLVARRIRRALDEPTP